MLRAAAPAGSASRIGGDEFAILLPGTDESEVLGIQTKILALVRQDNRDHADRTLSLAVGVATRHAPGPLEAAVRQADLRMYEAKRAHYAARPMVSRRRPTPSLTSNLTPLPVRSRPLTTDH